ncbi:MAG: 30S ribosomal protein S9 [Candidatus Gracilibacteria bacterium]|jgi:small subunit ribosomal protein S9|nr:30S ribosomal protein S9 [Candidatus Peribacteria bacterium]
MEKKYFYAIGRRKTATAQVRLFADKGSSLINGRPFNEYISRSDLFARLLSPLKIASLLDSTHFEVQVNGSGISAQADAIALGLARAVILLDPALRPQLKGADLLSRDARKVERKKPGLHKARKGPSWSKR